MGPNSSNGSFEKEIIFSTGICNKRGCQLPKVGNLFYLPRKDARLRVFFPTDRQVCLIVIRDDYWGTSVCLIVIRDDC
jgi:hypothetical protein